MVNTKSYFFIYNLRTEIAKVFIKLQISNQELS